MGPSLLSALPSLCLTTPLSFLHLYTMSSFLVRTATRPCHTTRLSQNRNNVPRTRRSTLTRFRHTTNLTQNWNNTIPRLPKSRNQNRHLSLTLAVLIFLAGPVQGCDTDGSERPRPSQFGSNKAYIKWLRKAVADKVPLVTKHTRLMSREVKPKKNTETGYCLTTDTWYVDGINDCIVRHDEGMGQSVGGVNYVLMASLSESFGGNTMKRDSCLGKLVRVNFTDFEDERAFPNRYFRYNQEFERFVKEVTECLENYPNSAYENITKLPIYLNMDVNDEVVSDRTFRAFQRRMAQRTFSSRDSPVTVRLLQEIVAAQEL